MVSHSRRKSRFIRSQQGNALRIIEELSRPTSVSSPVVSQPVVSAHDELHGLLAYSALYDRFNVHPKESSFVHRWLDFEAFQKRCAHPYRLVPHNGYFTAQRADASTHNWLMSNRSLASSLANPRQEHFRGMFTAATPDLALRFSAIPLSTPEGDVPQRHHDVGFLLQGDSVEMQYWSSLVKGSIKPYRVGVRVLRKDKCTPRTVLETLCEYHPSRPKRSASSPKLQYFGMEPDGYSLLDLNAVFIP